MRSGRPGPGAIGRRAAGPERSSEREEVGGDGHRELSRYILAEDSSIQRAAALLQATGAPVGVKIKVQALELGELNQRTGRGSHDGALSSWFSCNGDPDNFFTPHLFSADRSG